MPVIQNLQSKIQNSNRQITAARRRLSPAAQDIAARYLVGGVNSPVRAFRAVGQPPVVLTEGRGALLRDVDGRRYLDFIMGWGAAILGHAHADVVHAVRRQVGRGAHVGLTHEAEARLAQAISDAIPSIEQVRFTASGTEACMTAIRVARGATGRSKVLTFEGCYHGHSDGLLVKRGSGLATLGLASSAGVPEPIAQQTLVAPYNDPAALEDIFNTFGGQIACVILEPVAANMGVVVPERKFLERVRELATRHGAILIFDEVVTGFRTAYGGLQRALEITPDLTVLGKIIGGGFPIGAVGGSRALMSKLAPEGPVYHAGTFAGHPVAMVAGCATLEALRREDPYKRLERMGRELADGLAQAAARAGVPVQVNRLGSMLTVFFNRAPVRRFDEARQADLQAFAGFANELRRQGVLIPPSQFETLFLSTAHTDAMLAKTLRAARAALLSVSDTYRGPR